MHFYNNVYCEKLCDVSWYRNGYDFLCCCCCCCTSCSTCFNWSSYRLIDKCASTYIHTHTHIIVKEADQHYIVCNQCVFQLIADFVGFPQRVLSFRLKASANFNYELRYTLHAFSAQTNANASSYFEEQQNTNTHTHTVRY